MEERKQGKDEVPADVAALRRALLAQAMRAPVPPPSAEPMDRTRAVLDERMSSAPSNARESARMEQVLRSVIESGVLSETVATVACAATMCKVELLDSDNARVDSSTGALSERVSKTFAATTIYPQGDGKRTMYLASNSEDLRLGPPPAEAERVVVARTPPEGKE